MKPPELKYNLLSGYTHRVAADITVNVPELAGQTISHPYFQVYRNGRILVRKGYCWDGPSGPAIKTKDTLLMSLIHDVLYQAIRLGLLPKSYRLQADIILYRLGCESGMHWWRALYYFVAVRICGWRHIRPCNEDSIDIIHSV